MYFCGQTMKLEVWPNTAQRCNHQFTACPSYSLYVYIYILYIIYIYIYIYIYHHHHHHLFLKRPFLPRSARVRRFSRMRSLHISLNTTHSGCKPSSSISSFTHSFQVFLPLPAHLTPAATTFLQADTQSSPLLRSTCQTTSIYHASPPQPHSEPSKDCTNPHCAFYPQRHPTHPSRHHPLRPLQT